MADYKSSLESEEIEASLKTAHDLSKTAGIIKADGRGHVSTSRAGEDYGYPLLRGNGAPTVNLSGSVGQHYFNLAAQKAPYEYVCVGLYSGGYRWLPIGEGGGGGFAIRGYYSTLEELQTAVPSPNVGDAYGVGSVGDYDIYIFDGVSGTWMNNGNLKGEPGVGIPPHGSKGQYLGKASADSYDTAWLDMAMLGEDAPTELTEPEYIGQLYVDTTATAAPYIYVCTGSVVVDGGTEYVWRPVMTEIAAGSLTAAMYAPQSVGTSAIMDNSISREKLGIDALYSPIVNVTSAAYSLSANDYGKTLFINASGKDVIIDISEAFSEACPVGVEFAAFAYEAKSVKVMFAGVRVRIAGKNQLGSATGSGSVLITQPNGMAALKKLYADPTSGDVWTISGNVEVV